jgi:hypothetical protein
VNVTIPKLRSIDMTGHVHVGQVWLGTTSVWRGSYFDASWQGRPPPLDYDEKALPKLKPSSSNVKLSNREFQQYEILTPLGEVQLTRLCDL